MESQTPPGERKAGRGRGRGRGRHHSRGRPFNQGLTSMPLGRFDNRELRFIDAIETPLGEHTQAPAPHASTGDGTGLPDAVITDVRVLGSYNLTQHDNPKILVPGSPPIWRNSPLPHSVPADVQVFRGGPVYVDEGAGTKQAESILKMLTAVELCTPNFDWNQVDIVVERSSLRQLLRWVGSPASRKQDFRMDMHLAGEKTLVLTRWEQNIVYGPSPGSYGFSYQRHETAPAPDCGMSKFVGHERIITYDFGGLSVVVCSEVDARLPRQASSALDDAAEGFTVTHITPSSGRLFGNVTYRRAGTLVPQEELVEIATRTRKSMQRGGFNELYPQVYFGWTPHLFVAYHQGDGCFDTGNHEKLGETSSLMAAAEQAKPSLRRLRNLLQAFQALALQYGTGINLTLLLRRGELEVFRRERGAVLPIEIVARFAQPNS